MATESSTDQVIALVTRFGFVPDGTTRTQQVRIPTTRSPVFGHGRNPPGGELRTLGGRLRFVRGKMHVTVGRFSTYFYGRVDDLSGPPPAMFQTKDIAGIAAYLEKLPQPEAQG